MFEKLQERYEKHYIRLDQLGKYVQLGVITAAQFAQISGETYTEQA